MTLADIGIGDRVLVVQFYCGVIPRAIVGQQLRVCEVGVYGGVYLRRADRRICYVPGHVAARCLEKVTP